LLPKQGGTNKKRKRIYKFFSFISDYGKLQPDKRIIAAADSNKEQNYFKYLILLRIYKAKINKVIVLDI